MALKLVKRGATYYIRGTVSGQSIYESTRTADRRRADEYRALREAEAWKRAVYGHKAVATFDEAVVPFLEKRTRSAREKARIAKLLDHYTGQLLSSIGEETLPAAYDAILTEGRNASPAAKMRAVLAPLRAILRNAARLKMCDPPMFDPPKVTKPNTPYLKPAEATRLVASAPGWLRPLLIFQIGTGCRMAEALELTWGRVDLRGAEASVWQKQQNFRQAALPPIVVSALASIPDKSGAVFRPRKVGQRALKPGEWAGYANSGRQWGGQIKSAWATTCRKAGLPGRWHKWQTKKGKHKRRWVPEITPHALRHTWATWHYAIHKDLLRLRHDGRWSTTEIVERYAKLMPEVYRDEALAWLEGKLPDAAGAA